MNFEFERRGWPGLVYCDAKSPSLMELEFASSTGTVPLGGVGCNNSRVAHPMPSPFKISGNGVGNAVHMSTMSNAHVGIAMNGVQPYYFHLLNAI